jgi:hypothetical protein
MPTCPKCGDPNAYVGIFGWSCSSTVCSGRPSPTQALIDKQKDVAHDVLAQALGCCKGGGHAIIAGGAPRQWYFNKPARDVDIFVHGCYVSNLFGSLKIGDDEISICGSSGANSIQKIVKGIHKFTYKDVDFDLVEMQNPVNPNSVFNTFDFGICKIAWLSDKSTVTDPDFDLDVANKTLTLRLEKLLAYRKPTSVAQRFKKMKALFPDYEVVIL